jgi:hypothetical protein
VTIFCSIFVVAFKYRGRAENARGGADDDGGIEP